MKGFILAFEVVERLREFSEAAGHLSGWPTSGAPVGHRLVQSDLAKTYRSIGDKGVEFFYRGPFADSVEQWMKRSGGKLMAQDLAAYRAIPEAADSITIPPIRSGWLSSSQFRWGSCRSNPQHSATFFTQGKGHDLCRLGSLGG